MAGLIPFNKKNNGLTRTGFEDFYNMLDDFFTEGWTPRRNLLRDTFKLDVKETDGEYLVEAEMPGVKKDEIDLSVDDEILTISVNREESVDQEHKGYLHKERRTSSMSRSVRLLGATADGIKASLKEGVLSVTIPKQEKKETARKISID